MFECFDVFFDAKIIGLLTLKASLLLDGISVHGLALWSRHLPLTPLLQLVYHLGSSTARDRQEHDVSNTSDQFGELIETIDDDGENRANAGQYLAEVVESTHNQSIMTLLNTHIYSPDQPSVHRVRYELVAIHDSRSSAGQSKAGTTHHLAAQAELGTGLETNNA